MRDATELIWRIAGAAEVAEREDSAERARTMRIQFNRQLQNFRQPASRLLTGDLHVSREKGAIQSGTGAENYSANHLL